jgi:hypothetical protein
MLRTSGRPIQFTLVRGGGARILAQAEVWRPTPNGWVLVGLAKFSDAGIATDVRGLTDEQDQPVPNQQPGQYTTRFRLLVSEKLAIGGSFQFQFFVGNQLTYQDAGNVNTTPSSDDQRNYDDLFQLVVT